MRVSVEFPAYMEEEKWTKGLVDERGVLKVAPVEASPAKMEEAELEDVAGDRLKKPPTAYFLFMMAHRKEFPGVSNKDISSVWASFGPEERQQYVRQAAELKEEYNRKVQALQLNEPDVPEKEIDDKDEPDDQSLAGALFPLSKLKSVIKMDEEYGNKVKGESVKYLQQAMYAFASDLCTKSILEMRRNKKKKITAAHLYAAIEQDAKYSWLLDSNIWPEDAIPQAKEAPAPKSTQATPSQPKPKMDEEARPPKPQPAKQPLQSSSLSNNGQPKPTTLNSFFQRK